MCFRDENPNETGACRNEFEIFFRTSGINQLSNFQIRFGDENKVNFEILTKIFFARKKNREF